MRAGNAAQRATDSPESSIEGRKHGSVEEPLSTIPKALGLISRTPTPPHTHRWEMRSSGYRHPSER